MSKYTVILNLHSDSLSNIDLDNCKEEERANYLGYIFTERGLNSNDFEILNVRKEK